MKLNTSKPLKLDKAEKIVPPLQIAKETIKPKAVKTKDNSDIGKILINAWNNPPINFKGFLITALINKVVA